MSLLPEQVVITLTLSDERWPLITVVGTRQSSSGITSAVKDQQQYDLAYNKFEVVLHNLLRPAVDQLIARRKGPKPNITQGAPNA